MDGPMGTEANEPRSMPPSPQRLDSLLCGLRERVARLLREHAASVGANTETQAPQPANRAAG